jgi:small subunit ribosomal protein S14
MAKKSKIIHNNYVNNLVTKLKDKRTFLSKVIKSEASSLSEKMSALKFFTKNRSSSSTRYKNRCNITGYSRSYMRNFGISKKVFYDYVSIGVICGVKKSN